MAVLALFAAGITALSLSGSTATGSGARLSPAGWARRDARAFLSRYVTDDGRVVRWDQGDDTVSEGQAYALLVSVALGDRSELARVWRWEQRHLQLADGLFAYRWADGKVASSTPATDADLDTAWALVLAGRRFHDPGYTAQGLRVAASVLRYETVPIDGHLALVAGPWARSGPAVFDASYVSPEAMAALAATGSSSWRTLEQSATALVGRLAGAVATHLPADWATLAPTGAVTPAGTGGGAGTPTYGLDAQRVAVWFAADCSATGRRIAADEWPALQASPGTGGRISYRLDGRPLSRSVNPLGYVAAAAAAISAGHRSRGRSLLAEADRQDRSYHTYYGAAWLALGRILLDTSWLSPCPPA